ncbi:MAG: DUF4837 family protein [Bacteroidales bacterium]|nr:DUF4837 family protein [Bacteroidales bacterium]
MKNSIHALIASLAVSALTILPSCKSGKALLPNVSGKAGEVVVVMQEDMWNGALGTAVRGSFAADCEFLPQKEPLYDLVNVIPSGFTNMFKMHRNIVIFNVDGKITEPGVIYKNDVWAAPQCVISVNAANLEGAQILLEENLPQMLVYVEQAERNRIIANSRLYPERSLDPIVTEMVGGSPVFPSGYTLRKKSENFIWIAYETTYTTQGILIYKYPSSGTQADFELEDIIRHSDEILKENVPGMFDGTYMMTSTFATPSITFEKYQGRAFASVHGLWEVYKDFMGGPFVSHVFYSRDGKEMIVMQGFVYAPKFEKRHYLRQVESILYSFSWASPDRDTKE